MATRADLAETGKLVEQLDRRVVTGQQLKVDAGALLPLTASGAPG